MNGSEINTAVNRNNNFEDRIIMDKEDEKSKPMPMVAVGLIENTETSEVRIRNLTSNNRNENVNLDEVNISSRVTVSELSNLNNDNPDIPIRSRKPQNYAARKTAAQGMIDIALLTSNANQLKNLIDYQREGATFWFVLTMIIISLLLQVTVGVSLIFKNRFNSKIKDKAAAARVNNWVMSGVFVITVINIFIAVFSTGPPPQRSENGTIGSMNN